MIATVGLGHSRGGVGAAIMVHLSYTLHVLATHTYKKCGPNLAKSRDLRVNQQNGFFVGLPSTPLNAQAYSVWVNESFSGSL